MPSSPPSKGNPLLKDAPVVWRSESLDGGLTWSEEKIVVRMPTRWAQPAVIRPL